MSIQRIFKVALSDTSHIHYKVNKPYGMLSQLKSNDLKEIRSKAFLSELHDFPVGIMPIGRLDKKSEGLLLMTTDGKLSDRINRSGIEKEYLVQLDGVIGQKDIDTLSKGVEIGFKGKRYLTRPCEVQLLQSEPKLPAAHPALRIERHRPGSWLKIIITEGKFRQVRKMTAAVGYPTLRLIRVRIGSTYLGDMAPGEVQEIIAI